MTAEAAAAKIKYTDQSRGFSLECPVGESGDRFALIGQPTMIVIRNGWFEALGCCS